MSSFGYLQDLSQLIEYPQCLLSITDDEDPVQSKEEKLIEDSESSYKSAHGPTPVPKISRDSFPTTSYYADLASLLDIPDPKPHPASPDLRAFSTLSQNLAGETTNLLRISRRCLHQMMPILFQVCAFKLFLPQYKCRGRKVGAALPLNTTKYPISQQPHTFEMSNH